MILVHRSFPLGFYFFLVLFLGLVSACAPAAPRSYDLHYTVELQPAEDRAQVAIEIADATLVKKLEFRIKPKIHSGISANGTLEINGDRASWTPPAENARFSLFAKITHLRDDGEFDARMTPDWAIFRGDDLVPAASVTARAGGKARATLDIKLPKGWTSAISGWPIDSDYKSEDGKTVRFLVDNPERKFDRPTGWIIAGKLASRREIVGETELVVASPRGDSLRRMDRLAFLTLIWPGLEEAFGLVPRMLLVIGADDPMWRGGLSGPNSLYLHSDRPIVSENGTSSLVHEAVHAVTRLTASGIDDWIVEGLAEYYSFELLHRAGAMTASRRARVLEKLAEWGAEVTTLRTKRSTGPVTARAVVLIAELDEEIRRLTNNTKTIDDVARPLIKLRKVSLADLREICARLTDTELKTLQSPLLGGHL